jgi:molecular chaperone GrpE
MDNNNPTPQDASSPQNDKDFATLQAELEQTQNKLDEMMNIAKRALADLQNYKKRAEEEKAAFVAFANAELIAAILPALNNFERALTHEPKDAEWAKGVEQIYRQLTNELQKRGLSPIDAKGQKFDPHLHEALLAAPGEKDLVLEELEKGWMLGDRVLKPARVKVGNGEPVPSPDTSNQHEQADKTITAQVSSPDTSNQQSADKHTPPV